MRKKQTKTMIRPAQVAGQFYPADPARLKQELDKLIPQQQSKRKALGLIAPHAGYMFSGQVAGECFARVKLTKTVIILGPNHTGLGPPFSIMTEGSWQMPLGQVRVDSAWAEMILKGSKNLQADVQAHLYEHSIEVQLPFLQFLQPDVQIVPIVLAAAGRAQYNEVAQAIAQAIKQQQSDCLIVASSDMTHYEPQQKAQEQDRLAIEAILDLQVEKFLKRIKDFNITMCGYAPAACMLLAAKQLGAQKAELIKYQTSGDTSGDYSSVVGYAGILVA